MTAYDAARGEREARPALTLAEPAEPSVPARGLVVTVSPDLSRAGLLDVAGSRAA